MKVAFGGDISVTSVCKKLFADQAADELFTDVKDVFESCDRTVINLECCITERGTKIRTSFGCSDRDGANSYKSGNYRLRVK